MKTKEAMRKSQMVREIRRIIAGWPERLRGAYIETAEWGRKPAWWIARRYSDTELMDMLHDVDFGRGDLLEDDNAPP